MDGQDCKGHLPPANLALTNFRQLHMLQNNIAPNPMENNLHGKKLLLVGGCGYIGTYLYGQLAADGFDITVCDRLNKGNPLGVPVLAVDYVELDADFLRQFDAILWFAGHSNVGDSIADPSGAIANNCLNLYTFAQRIAPHTKFIYASSASLYSSMAAEIIPSNETSLVTVPSQNPYDISKFAFDYLAEHFLGNFYGLRMGTLAGYSSNLRPELIFNAMNLNARQTGVVRVRNRDACRTILLLEDLWGLVRNLLRQEALPGFYNAGSLSFRIGELGERIAALWGAELVDEGTSPTYSFLLDCGKMASLGQAPRASGSFEQLCRQFISSYESAKAAP